MYQVLVHTNCYCTDTLYFFSVLVEKDWKRNKKYEGPARSVQSASYRNSELVLLTQKEVLAR